MVRLKVDLLGDDNAPLKGFNSLMVRLKEVLWVIRLGVVTWFQFPNGSIKSQMKTSLIAPPISCFNSLMVRLKVIAPFIVSVEKFRFNSLMVRLKANCAF